MTQNRRSRAVSDPTTSTPPSANHHFSATKSNIVVVAWRYKDAAKSQAAQGLIPWAVFRRFCADVDAIKRTRLSAARAAADRRIATDRGEYWAGTPALMSHGRRLRLRGLFQAWEWDDPADRDCPVDADDYHWKLKVASIRRADQKLSDQQVAQRLHLHPKFVARVRQDANGITSKKQSGENSREERQKLLAYSMSAKPELSDREHARRVGVDHKTVAAMRRRLQDSGEIARHLWRVDPRTGKLSQPSQRRTDRTVAWSSSNEDPSASVALPAMAVAQ